ncbi:hypothetical protein Ae201684P_000946 [Aphanomyces euteiches]|nr:hypothetical protein Ae201684P_000946 [Aphanomyces euteiches]KAH9133425.1 hypothetical protein AeRB84_020560 [Aphanomyces euteiches]
MREVGSIECAVNEILDVAPDQWVCIREDNTNSYFVHGPKVDEKVKLQVSEETLVPIKETRAIAIATTGRFHTVPTTNNTYDIALGFSNGYVCVYNRPGEELFSLQCHRDSVARLEWNFHSAKAHARELYVLFSDKTLVIIEWEMDPTPKRYWRKYSLNGQRDIISVLPCRDTPTSLFQNQPRAGLQTLMAVGCDPVVGFYLAGHEGTSLFRIAHLASAVASRAAGAVWSLARNWGWPQEKENDTIDAVPSDLGMHVALGMPDTQRRRARDLCLSPNGKLALIPDALGRILLIDTTTMLMIRLWKGYRDAQCAWMTQDGPNKGLYMVFYSARRGLVEVWRARHGPRVLCQPIGAQAKLKLATCITKTETACVVVWEKSDGSCSSCTVELDAGSTTTIKQYFAEASHEEESFRLHQLLDGLEGCLTKPDRMPSVLEQMRGLTTIASVQTLVDELHQSKMGALNANFHRDALKTLLEVVRKSRNWADSQAEFSTLVFIFNLEWKAHLIQGYIDLQQEVTPKPFGSLFDEDKLLARMTKWRQVYTFEVKRKTQSLNCLEFIECFAAPWSDPLSSEVELSLGLMLHKKLQDNSSLVECVQHFYAILKSPVLRSPLLDDVLAGLVTIFFAPLSGSVFGIQRVREIHRKLLLDQDNERYTNLFLAWYFALPIDDVLSMTATNASSCLQRWLEPWIQGSSYPHSIDESSFTLPELHPSLQLIFEKCRDTQLLIHAFVLSHHVAHGTIQHANALQDNTLGQVSATGAGLRWEILQQCLSQCLYFSCLLKVPGKLNVKSIESLDELMKFIAIVHLNRPDQELSIPYDPKDEWIDLWQNSSKSHAVMSVLHSFRRLQHAESLVSFRALMLCSAWNNDRSRMTYLELAIQEVENSDFVRQALVVYLWERYIRAQVRSILDYWIEVSSGRSVKKGLDPTIAGEFLRLVLLLLEVLEETCISPQPAFKSPHNDEENVNLSQLLEHVVWTGTPLDVLNLYTETWPASPTSSSLMRQLTTSDSRVMENAVKTHHQLVSVLMAFTAYPSLVVPLKTLFEPSRLCVADCFQSSISADRQDERYEFVMKLLHHDIARGMAVATSFQLPLDKVKQDHAVWLYQSGKDALAEEVLDKVLIESPIVTRMGRSRSEYAALMSQIPADMTAWICSKEAPLIPDPEVAKLDVAPSLTATNALLHQCVLRLPPGSRELTKCYGMTSVVQRLLEQLKQRK